MVGAVRGRADLRELHSVGGRRPIQEERRDHDRHRPRPAALDPRCLALGEELGALRGVLRPARICRVSAGVAAEGGGRRGASRGRRRARRARSDGDRRPLRGADPRARLGARPRRSLVRRADRRAPPRPRARAGRSRAEPCAAEGHPRPPVFIAQGGVAGARTPVPLARGRPSHARGVHLRLREHVLRRGRRGSLRALRRPRDRPDLLRGRLRELPPPPADRAPLQER